MKKILLSLAMLFISVTAHATTCTIPYVTEVAGGIIYSAQWNANFIAVANCLNNQTLDGTTNIAIGGILTANLANLSVTDAKIAGITTAGKVNGSAITQINNVPSGAGELPELNIAPLDGSGNGVSGAAFNNLGNTPVGAGQLPAANETISGIVGTASSKNFNQVYQAATDVLVTASCYGSINTGALTASGDIGATSSPVTPIWSFTSTTNNTVIPSPVGSMLVPKNFYYEVNESNCGNGQLVNAQPIGQ